MFLLTVFQKKKKTKDKQMMEKILKINNLKLTKKNCELAVFELGTYYDCLCQTGCCGWECANFRFAATPRCATL